MKRYQHLTITHQDPEQLVALLDRMKETSSRVFKFLKTETINYAKNILRSSDKVACFKTERKSYFESKVWLYIGESELVVANITSESNRNLGIGNYNIILNAFFSEVVEPLIDGYDYILSREDIDFNLILPEDVFNALNLWQSTCDRNNPLAQHTGFKSWLNFIVLYYNKRINYITAEDLQQWLLEDCHWSSEFIDAIDEIASCFDYSLELLKDNDEYNNR